MIHLGDQVYCDWIPNLALNSSSLIDRDSLIDQFRSCYRQTWGINVMQKILRSGPNWMLPDDHEVINNISPDMLDNPQKRDIISAGLQVIAEYEYSLYQDADLSKWNSFYSIDFSKRAQFIDLRFERVIGFSQRKPLLGDSQWEYLSKAISKDENREQIDCRYDTLLYQKVRKFE
jgi:hypothetical protein